MCGIVGYVGRQRALPILLDGLKRLEYRGYDSAGVSLQEPGAILTSKRPGRVNALEQTLQHIDSRATVGIAHTRWATHGPPTEANAHPHGDCRNETWVCHNGIIENHKTLRDILRQRGHLFRSQTDSEILAHLIEEGVARGESLGEATGNALRGIEGTFGIAVISARDPGKLVAARRSAPLILGASDGENLVASDASAILGHTRRVVYLDDDELAVVTAGGYDIQTIDHRQVSKCSQVLEWSVEQAERGGYPHFMLKEIFEASVAIENALRGRVTGPEGIVRLDELEALASQLASIERLAIVSCGTSWHAAMAGKYMLQEFASLPVDVACASELRYHCTLLGRPHSPFLSPARPPIP